MERDGGRQRLLLVALRVRGTLPSQWATLLEDEGFKYEPLDEDAPVAPPETI